MSDGICLNPLYNVGMKNSIDTFHSLIEHALPKSMVFFGGAGVSTESGIPDFRSASGIFSTSRNDVVPAETMVSRSFFDAHPDEFFRFYCEKMLFREAEPNQAHKKLAELERTGILSAVITQNVDGLHQKAGSETVHELHGSSLRNYCMGCSSFFTLDQFFEHYHASENGVPLCPTCGNIIKPDVVLYEESLDQQVMQSAIDAISNADLMVIAGTSLAVYPAAGLIDYFSGSHLVIINRTPTPADRKANLLVEANIGDAFR